MQRRSIGDNDGIVWQTVGVPLGSAGLDLRHPGAPGSLADLLNARFRDEKTVERRDGHTGRALQDGGAFIDGDKTVTGWSYGHGTVILPIDNEQQQNVHHPVHNRGGGVFSDGDNEVVWTGDRLLISTADGEYRGRHSHWDRDDSEVTDHGVPAYLPVQTDSTPPLTAERLDTALTSTHRVIAYVDATDSEALRAMIIERATGAIVSDEEIISDDGDVIQVRVVNSAGTPLVLFINDGGLAATAWDGDGWPTPDVLDADAEHFDVDQFPAGCHVAWLDSGDVFAGKFLGGSAVDSPYAFGSQVDTNSTAATDAVAIAVSPSGNLGFAWWVDDSGALDVWATIVSPNLITSTAAFDATGTDGTGDVGGLSVCFRGLTNEDGRHPFVITRGQVQSDTRPGVQILEYDIDSDEDPTLLASDWRYNAVMVTRSFRVGDEVFSWLGTENSETTFLVGGVVDPQVCGIADREASVFSDLRGITQDPLDGHTFTWVRPYDTGTTYDRPGNTRIGDLNFLPPLSAAAYGKSVYLAGSHVRAWDGQELGDAGWHDYPRTTIQGSNSTGALANNGAYQFRVYPVRYNNRGERFQGAAVTASVTLGAADDTATLTITTVPVTNHSDVVFEVYRTTNGGSAFYLDGTVANNLGATTVQYTSTVADSSLDDAEGDPHAPGIGFSAELEEFGPLGCSVLTVAGDRLWGIGGQVPAGSAQFSKLYEAGEGVGFDALAGVQAVDVTGAPLTSVAPLGDATVVLFQAGRLHVITNTGPDNFGNGAFGTPQLVVAEGASVHSGTIVTPIGIAFWGVDGPRLLTQGFRVENISEPVLSLTSSLSPSGVRCDSARREVVWYTPDGDALLWNYTGGRWARWNGLPVAGCSPRSLVTTDGRHLTPDPDATMDDGRRFEFVIKTGPLHPEALLTGGTSLRRVGLTGVHNGPHRVRIKVYYNGAPLWSERVRWEPEEGTWLTSAEEWEDLTPAEVDALDTTDRTGVYSTHRRVARLDCRFFAVHLSDCGDDGFTPWELALEVGAKPGLGRVPVNTFS